MLTNLNHNNENEENSSNYTSSKYITPDGVPADVAIFTITFDDRTPQELPKTDVEVLMVKRKHWPYKGCWALPGGFSNPNETLLEAAKRELREETKIDNLHIEHLDVYSTPGRDPRKWIISSAYYALVNENHLKDRQAADDAEEVKLISLGELLCMLRGEADGDYNENNNTIAFDHDEIILDAYQKIKEKMLSTDIAKEFLPEEFTLTELFNVIKTVVPEFNEKLPNFRRKILQRNIIKEVKGKTSNKYSKRHAQLFTFTGETPIISIYS